MLPVTTVAVPRPGSVLKGEQRLVGEASDVYGVSKVEFELSGGVLRNQMIATAADTPYRSARRLEHHDRAQRQLHT